MEDRLYTVAEVAKILKTNTDYVYRLQRAGVLPFLKLGRYKCRKVSLENFLARSEGYDITDPDNIRPLEVDVRPEEG